MSSVLPSLSVYPRQRKIYLFLALLFASTLIQLWPLYHLQPLRVILRVGACNMLIILSLTACYRLLVGKILALGVSLLLTVNFMIALCTWEIYQSDFNIVFAMSILETHWAEVKSMTGMYISWMPVCVIYFLLTYFSIHNGAKCLSSKIQRAAMVILLIFLAWFTYSQWTTVLHNPYQQLKTLFFIKLSLRIHAKVSEKWNREREDGWCQEQAGEIPAC